MFIVISERKEPVLSHKWLERAVLGFFSAISDAFSLKSKEMVGNEMNGSYCSVYGYLDLIKRYVALPLTPRTHSLVFRPLHGVLSMAGVNYDLLTCGNYRL